jgi:hypothetical protein
VWAMYYFFKQVRQGLAPNPNNTLLIRKGVDLGRKVATREEVGRRVDNMLFS